jgi:hypothetical protein
MVFLENKTFTCLFFPWRHSFIKHAHHDKDEVRIRNFQHPFCHPSPLSLSLSRLPMTWWLFDAWKNFSLSFNDVIKLGILGWKKTHNWWIMSRRWGGWNKKSRINWKIKLSHQIWHKKEAKKRKETDYRSRREREKILKNFPRKSLSIEISKETKEENKKILERKFFFSQQQINQCSSFSMNCNMMRENKAFAVD